MRAPGWPPQTQRARLVRATRAAVPSGGVSRIGVACGTTITAVSGGCEPTAADRAAYRHVSGTFDSKARDRVGDEPPVGNGLAVEQPARRVELRLVVDSDGAVAASGDHAAASGESGRRLRVAPPVQLELACESGESRSAAVWAGLPATTREAVLVLLARLIGAGAIEERS